MKRFFVLPIALSLFIFSSCKKDAATTAAGISATINGTPTTFNVTATAAVDTTGGNQAFVLLGLSALSVSATEMTLTFNNVAGHVAAGTTFSDTSSVGLDALIGFANNGTGLSYANGGAIPDISHITVTSISATHIEGTFSGRLVKGSGTGDSVMVVSNGTFSLPLTYVP